MRNSVGDRSMLRPSRTTLCSPVCSSRSPNRNSDWLAPLPRRIRRAAPGDQLSQVKRLRHEVIGTRIQHRDDSLGFLYSGQDQDGCGVLSRAQMQHDVVAAFAGQHQVQHDQVVLSGGTKLQSLCTVVNDIDRIARSFPQSLSNVLRQSHFVFDEQNAHESSLETDDCREAFS